MAKAKLCIICKAKSRYSIVAEKVAYPVCDDCEADWYTLRDKLVGEGFAKFIQKGVNTKRQSTTLLAPSKKHSRTTG